MTVLSPSKPKGLTATLWPGPYKVISVSTQARRSFRLTQCGLKNKTKSNVASALKVNPYFVGDYDTAARNYPMRKVSQIISLLRDADMKSKGVGASNLNQGDILKELLFKIMH